jgi:hypothetical protein
MNGNKIFVDTNILIYFLQGDKDVIAMISDKEIVISFITELELLSLPKISDKSKKLIKELLKICLIIDINAEFKDLAIEFRKKSKIKLPDAIIAATAYFHQLPLLTADKQFKSIEELEVLIYEL